MDINLRQVSGRAGLRGAAGRARASRRDEHHRRGGRTAGALARGFSLVEMMVVMAMLSVIVLGLYSVFNQTQRALISNNAQVDVLENGRTTLDLVGREIEQAVAWGRRESNYSLMPHLWTRIDYRNPDNQRPYTQTLNDGTVRTNLLQECFFLSRSNHWWVGNGFFVATPTNGTYLGTNEVWQSGVGTLYRFSLATNPISRLATNLPAELTTAYLRGKTNALQAFPVAEGITHFRLRPYDAWGTLMTNNWTRVLTNPLNRATAQPIYVTNLNPNILAQLDPISTEGAIEYRWYFLSNSLPAYLELELGVVKPYVLQRMRSIPSPAAQRAFLTNQAGAVSIFHKMIPLRNAQP